MDFPLASLRFLERKRRPRARAPRVSWHSSSKSNNNNTNNDDDRDHEHEHHHAPQRHGFLSALAIASMCASSLDTSMMCDGEVVARSNPSAKAGSGGSCGFATGELALPGKEKETEGSSAQSLLAQ